MKKTDARTNKIPQFDATGKKQDALELNKDIFDGKFNKALLYQSILMYRANQRKGTASTKRRGEVRGGGKKPWRQKGTGRARTSSIRNPIWRGGGVVFGPHPRDFRYSLPKKIKSNALKASLNAKLKSGRVTAVSDLPMPEPKTKIVSGLLRKLKITESVLLIVEQKDKNLVLATRNIKGLTLKTVGEITAYNVLSSAEVVITKNAANILNGKF